MACTGSTRASGSPQGGGEPARRAMVGGLALSSATILAGGGNSLVNAVLARWLSPRQFGDAGLLVTVLLVATAGAGTLQLLAARRVAGGEDPVTVRSELHRRAWSLGGGAALAMTVASGGLARLFHVDGALPFVVFALGLPWFLAQAVERGLLQGRFRFGALAATMLEIGRAHV